MLYGAGFGSVTVQVEKQSYSDLHAPLFQRIQAVEGGTELEQHAVLVDVQGSHTHGHSHGGHGHCAGHAHA